MAEVDEWGHDTKRPWTQDEIDGLKQKHKRTHFSHFPGLPRRWRSTTESGYEWVEIATGRYRRVKKEKHDG